MPLQAGSHAPYAPPKTVTTVIDGYRNRGLGTPITHDVLIRAGVGESLTHRTLQSFRALELLDGEGMPTPTFTTLREARGEDFNSRGEAWLRSVYEDVLQYADPSTDTPERLAEAFRGYQPNGQRARMATLLTGLWEYVGLPVAKAETGAKPRSVGAPVRNRTAPRSTANKPRGGAAGARGLPGPLRGLLETLPDGGWTQEERDKFVALFGNVLDYSIPIKVSDGDSGVAVDAEVGVDTS